MAKSCDVLPKKQDFPAKAQMFMLLGQPFDFVARMFLLKDQMIALRGQTIELKAQMFMLLGQSFDLVARISLLKDQMIALWGQTFELKAQMIVLKVPNQPLFMISFIQVL